MLILASKSPRRAQLLREAGYAFTQLESPFNDPLQPDASSSGLQGAKTLALTLARQKAHALINSHALPANSTILAADTICVDDAGRLIGTPDTESRARQMIQSFENKTHHVVTACCILSPRGPESCLADIATVHVGTIGPARLQTYLDTGKWQGKAGGYNLSERVADGWPITIEGDHDTVTGLPINKLIQDLARHGIHPRPPHDR